MYPPVFLSILPYLDPGSGSILIQVVIAALLGVGIFVRSQWARIKKLFGAESKDTSADDDEDKDADK